MFLFFPLLKILQMSERSPIKFLVDGVEEGPQRGFNHWTGRKEGQRMGYNGGYNKDEMLAWNRLRTMGEPLDSPVATRMEFIGSTFVRKVKSLFKR